MADDQGKGAARGADQRAHQTAEPPAEGGAKGDQEWHSTIANLMGPNRPPTAEEEPAPAQWLHRFLGC